MAELYSTGVNRIMYRAEAFATGKTVTAYFWNPSLTKSSLQTFSEVELGLYYLDYNFTAVGTYLGLFFENAVAKASGVFRVTALADVKVTTDKLDDTLEDDLGVYRFTENALEQAPSGAGLTGSQNDALMLIKNIMEGDVEIDTTQTPWQLIVKNKTTQDELLRKDLKDVNGAAITSVTKVIGRQTEP